MKANNKYPDIDGLSFRHVAQIVRRKMMTKIYVNKSEYSRKDKSWKKDIL
jgi:hypothetical protein